MTEGKAYEIVGKSALEAVGVAPIVDALESKEAFNPCIAALDSCFQFVAPAVMNLWKSDRKDTTKPLYVFEYLGAGAVDMATNTFAAFAGRENIQTLLSTKLALNYLTTMSFNVIKAAVHSKENI